MAFSPTPDDDTFDAGRPLTAPPAATDAPAGAPATPGDDREADALDTHGDKSQAGPADGARPIGTTVASSVAVLLLALVLMVLLLRRIRTFRHLRRGAPGAWAELLDALVLAGHAADPVLPATVIAEQTDQRYGGDGARRVAHQAERAVFGPPGPEVGQTPGLRQALHDVRRAARRALPAWRRWWWWLDPRVLRR